jgi:hypothetical protein
MQPGQMQPGQPPQRPGQQIFLRTGLPPVNLSDITVDETGRVVVTNSAFGEALRAHLQNPAALTQPEVKNGVCGNNC